MYGNIKDSLKDMTDERKNSVILYYDRELTHLFELVEYYKEKTEEKEDIKRETVSVERYSNLLDKNNKIYDELSKLSELYNSLRKDYIHLKEKSEEDINRVKQQEVQSLESMIPIIENLEKNQFRPNKSRGSSLSKSKKEKVIRLICQGLNDSEISRIEKVDRKTVKKIRTASYKSQKTNKEILQIINGLLKINQNPDYIRELKVLKNKYMSQ